MAQNRKQQHEQSGRGIMVEKRIPVTDHENPAVPEPASETSPRWHEPQGVQKEIADDDKIARTGSTTETVRNTPPAGAWNETSAD